MNESLLPGWFDNARGIFKNGEFGLLSQFYSEQTNGGFEHVPRHVW